MHRARSRAPHVGWALGADVAIRVVWHWKAAVVFARFLTCLWPEGNLIQASSISSPVPSVAPLVKECTERRWRRIEMSIMPVPAANSPGQQEVYR